MADAQNIWMMAFYLHLTFACLAQTGNLRFGFSFLEELGG